MVALAEQYENSPESQTSRKIDALAGECADAVAAVLRQHQAEWAEEFWMSLPHSNEDEIVIRIHTNGAKIRPAVKAEMLPRGGFF